MLSARANETMHEVPTTFRILSRLPAQLQSITHSTLVTFAVSPRDKQTKCSVTHLCGILGAVERLGMGF